MRLSTKLCRLSFLLAVPTLAGCALETETEGELDDVATQRAALCSAPETPDAEPSLGLGTVHGACFDYQYFEGTSFAGYNQCGFTVGIGPAGRLRRPSRFTFRADWVDPPTSSVACSTAYTSATAWGFRCDGADPYCQTGAWEHIGQVTRKGTWNSVSSTCYVEAVISTGTEDFGQVQVSTEGWMTSRLGNGGYQAMHASIMAYEPNGQCAHADADEPKRASAEP